MTKSCLIVDDSRVVRKVARRIVEDLGLTCKEVEDGAQAYEACQEQMPDAIMLDWNMPAMNGIEFLRKLRDMDGGTHPKVIFCTVNNKKDHIIEAVQKGANEYIMKPFDNEIVTLKFYEVGLID